MEEITNGKLNIQNDQTDLFVSDKYEERITGYVEEKKVAWVNNLPKSFMENQADFKEVYSEQWTEKTLDEMPEGWKHTVTTFRL